MPECSGHEAHARVSSLLAERNLAVGYDLSVGDLSNQISGGVGAVGHQAGLYVRLADYLVPRVSHDLFELWVDAENLARAERTDADRVETRLEEISELV